MAVATTKTFQSSPLLFELLLPVFQFPDGSLRIECPVPKPPDLPITDEAWHLDMMALVLEAHPQLRGLPAVDLDRATLPQSRAKRHAWRLQAGRVIVDPAVPDPVHPKQNLLNAIAAAASVDDLKSLLQRLVRDGS